MAPDAMLLNPRARLRAVTDSQILRVSAGEGVARGQVELRLDENGRIDGIPESPGHAGRHVASCGAVAASAPLA